MEDMYFIGVTTAASSMIGLFPRWAEALGLEAELIGHDLPLHAPRAAYRDIVERIRREPNTRGAVVTTHKIDLLDAARDLFDYLDPYAQLCQELSSISKRGVDGNQRLEGHAKDAISSRLTWQGFVPRGHFAHTGSSVLCLGAGGAAIAISIAVAHLSDPDDRPKRFVLVDRDPARLELIQGIHTRLEASHGIDFEYRQHDSAFENDRLMNGLEPGSVIVNATGMGKDRPGSPLGDAAVFPRGGIVWELNYRGSLEFWHQAEAQRVSRALKLEDGWAYFLHGWTQVIAQVFDLELTPELFRRLEVAAEAFRP
jgi:shikimate dehydrogenase